MFDHYPDHKKGEKESYFHYFQRSIAKYKTLRALLKGIIEETNSKQSIVLAQEGYLRDFSDRQCCPIFKEIDSFTFEVECFYKNFKDVQGYQTIEEVDLHDGYEQTKNFILHRAQFYGNELRVILLSPVSVMILRHLVSQYVGVDLIGFMHTVNQRQHVFIDRKN